VRKRDYSPATLDRIWEIFSWSINRMAIGKHPILDWDGRRIADVIESPLAGPYTAVLLMSEGIGSFMLRSLPFTTGTERFACAGCAVRRLPISIWPLRTAAPRPTGGVPDSLMNPIVHLWHLWVFRFQYSYF
jgi:hypothetical protein